MPFSKTRQIGNSHRSTYPIPVENDFKVFEVFTQQSRGLPHVHAGSLRAPGQEMAVEFARECFGQDESCVDVWVVAREHLASAAGDGRTINKAIEQDYRYARDYEGVRSKWLEFLDEAGLSEYAQDGP